MTFLVLGGFVLLVLGLTWFASRRKQHALGSCAPTDPRDDLRMREAFDGSGSDSAH